MPARPSGYYALSQYRPKPQSDDDDIAFLETGRDFTGDGQPENIGYGYQKTVPSGPAAYPAQLVDFSGHSPPNLLENVLLDYVKDAYAKDDEEGYHTGIDADTKRSLFRERVNDVNEYHSILPNHYEEDKQENIALPSLFRERFHSRENSDQGVDVEKFRRYATQALAKQLEAENEEEERLQNKRSDYGEESDKEEEYINLLQNIWEKYKEAKPHVLNIDDLTQNDVQEVLSFLINDRLSNHISQKRQYGYGSGFDVFNNAGLMGGWGSGSGSYAKRNKQRVDGGGQQGGNFLYSLKFVSPEANREAVETLTDDEGIEIPDERDEDILRLASGYTRSNPEDLLQIYGRPATTDEIYNPSEETYQRLYLENPDTGHRAASKKQLASLVRDGDEYHQVSPAELVMIPERNSNKRFIYEAKRKRYPVTKRSSNFYASPPMLHHKAFTSEGMKDSSKMKNAAVSGVTDPNVAKELNQIFSSSATHDETSKDSGQKPETSAKLTTSKEQKDLNHETTTAASVTTVSGAENSHTTGTETKASLVKNKTSGNTEDNNQETHTHGTSVHVEKETVEPITMSKIQTPLEIKKKSIDWSDYFGIDRRRKKTAPENIESNADDSNMVDDNWLLNQYYKTLAMVSNPLKKRLSIHSHQHSPTDDDNKRELHEAQIYNTDLFSRSSQREATKKNVKEDTGIDNMDSKLRNMEDLIVNEAVKYTGSHAGTQDPKEIQEMKDKIMSRLAAAYSLEKMRLALAEFKSSLQAQMMSKYNPENQRSSSGEGNAQDESKMKRVAVKKEKAEDDKHEDDSDDEKKKRNGNKKTTEDEISGEFLEGPVDVEPMSEGYMGRAMEDYETGCPILDQILHRCRGVGHMSDDRNQVFLPLCSLHQICNICGPAVGSPSASACDLMFATEADSICDEDIKCQRTSRQIITLLHRGHGMSITELSSDHCSNDSCLAQYFLTSPLPNKQPR